MTPTDWVRVRDTRTGHHLTVSAKQAEKGHFAELKQPATDRNGNPLPPKPKTDIPTTTTTKPAEGDNKETKA